MEKSFLKVLRELQISLKGYIEIEDRFTKIDTIAGVDTSYQNNLAKTCVCVLDYKSLEMEEKVVLEDKVNFAYKRNFLCFSEGPFVLKTISKLKSSFDCLLVDGNGILHPQNMGLATFLGIILKKPTIGVAKNLLLGSFLNLGKERGDFSYIRYRGKILGMALRTKKDTKELYISVGWGISLEKAKKIVLDTCIYKIPQPLRLAHMYSKIG
ncbi:MAG: endonuclease V [Candidatus Omnitrophica bacterium]|nr:endonuclease V [Candidatus Omnitrophota bacterium]